MNTINTQILACLAHAPQNTVPTPDSHQDCMVCGAGDSLGVQFQHAEDGVFALFQASSAWQGYQGVLHGGMISTLLDAAMTHCLFAQGVEAMTADLQVRFVKPVPCDETLRLQAKLLKKKHQLYQLSAELHCDGELLAHSQARFIQRKSV